MFKTLSAALLLLLAGGALAEPGLDAVIQDANGQPMALTQYSGKVVYLDFWASWCGPCRKSFPWMNDLSRRHGDDLVVLAVNLDPDPADAEAFIQEFKPRFTIGYDPEGKLARRFDLLGMPSSFLFDRQGQLVSTHVGFFTEKARDYEVEIEALVSAAGVKKP
ncbi:TlpA family protein disulfide reductase [Shewanella cyperi]|uniref:TlpA family protein disulfide reductase n=1 Tax=Shewanella cyperi TaxID=2814292 RepID=A0A974XHP0_9GAMM|nr:TlpA disulfide reductase family protein [Shewanella cyperi]QSX28499.1 TlpA family protein disulfide reductase [Shewanella cyperi]